MITVPSLEIFAEPTTPLGKLPTTPKGVHFTADYIVDADDNVAFLEGGPHHHLGAHPCCFPMGETQGLALTLTRPENKTLQASP